MGGDRPRIPKNTFTETIVNTGLFTENCASKNAKFHINFTEETKTEFWLDKHYWDRLHFGDNNGERINIDVAFVESLVLKSFKHLVYYSLKHKEFVFINHPPPKSRNIRVVLRQTFSNKPILNVAVEYHFLKLNTYEVTVKTAMSIEGFDLSDGQYAIEFTDNESTLYAFKNKKITGMDTYFE